MIQSYGIFRHNQTPKVLYPSIDLSQFDLQTSGVHKLLPNIKNSDVVITSLNRYERKKDIPLALRACSLIDLSNVVLVIAGGYDERVIENVEHHMELVQQSEKLKVKAIFLLSISNDERISLLKRTDILLYTPQNEHFEIVPLEAMYMRCTVIACNSGGPLESVVNGKTGYLIPPQPEAWAD